MILDLIIVGWIVVCWREWRKEKHRDREREQNKLPNHLIYQRRLEREVLGDG